MLIVWGTRRKEKRLGVAADFCPICRVPRRFQVTQVREYPHFYYVPVGRSTPVGYWLRCLECGARHYRKDVSFTAYTGKEIATYDEVAMLTNPTLASTYRERIVIEADVRRGFAPRPEDRLGWIAEPFEHLAADAEHRLTGETHFDRPSGVALAVTAAGLIGVTGALIATQDERLREVFGPVFFTLLFGGPLVTAVLLFSAGPRYVKRVLYPLLARALKPLRPTLEELTAIVTDFRNQKFQIGKRIKPAKLLAEIETLSGVIGARPG